MDEKKTPQPEQAAPETGKPLSEKRKSALLRYMAVLFCAAFILVLISLILQTHSSKAQVRSRMPKRFRMRTAPCRTRRSRWKRKMKNCRQSSTS